MAIWLVLKLGLFVKKVYRNTRIQVYRNEDIFQMAGFMAGRWGFALVFRC